MFIFDFDFSFVFYSFCFGGETQKVKHSFDDNSDSAIMVFTLFLSVDKYSALFVDDRAVRCLLSVDDDVAVQCIFGTFISDTTVSTVVITCQVNGEFQPSDSFCAQGK